MKLCSECYRYYTQPSNILAFDGMEYCETSSCSGILYDPDDFFTEAMDILHEKGYYIVGFCPGSVELGESYIVFDECIDRLPMYPAGYIINGEKSDKTGVKHIVVRKKIKSHTDYMNNSFNINIWASSLPAVRADNQDFFGLMG